MNADEHRFVKPLEANLALLLIGNPLAITIFATFAFFAVRYLCPPNMSRETKTRGN
jgi:hypothetical protein